MAIAKRECPSCIDGKLLSALPKRKATTGEIKKIPPIDCPDCDGKGSVTVEEKWESIGEEMKDRRLKNSYTLRRFCMDYDLDPVEVSKMERGLRQASKEMRVAYASISTNKA